MMASKFKYGFYHDLEIEIYLQTIFTLLHVLFWYSYIQKHLVTRPENNNIQILRIKAHQMIQPYVEKLQLIKV